MGPLPGTSFSSDLETADQRSPLDSTAHRLEGGRPALYFTFSPKRKVSVAREDMPKAILD